MHSTKLRLFSICIFYLSVIVSAQSKIETKYYLFELSDNSTIVGRIVLEDENVIQIKSVDGDEFRLNKANILKQTSVKVDPQSFSSENTLQNLKYVTLPDSSNIVRFELKGGSVLIGRIIKEDSTSVTINLLSNTETTISKNIIEDRELVTDKIVKGEYWNEDPNKTRLFFAPTGRGLKNGEAYFVIHELFFPMFAIGIGDFFTLAGGISLFPGGSSQMIYIAPKITPYQNDDFAISIGDFFVKYPDDTETLNIAYTVATVTSNAFSFTAGFGLETNDKVPVLMLGAEVRLSRYGKLISENWFFNNGDLKLLSLGFRFFGEHLAADFGFVTPWEEGLGGEFIMPWVGFAYNF